MLAFREGSGLKHPIPCLSHVHRNPCVAKVTPRRPSLRSVGKVELDPVVTSRLNWEKVGFPSDFLGWPFLGTAETIPRDPGSPKLRMVMKEPKIPCVSEVIIHPLLIIWQGDWILRVKHCWWFFTNPFEQICSSKWVQLLYNRGEHRDSSTYPPKAQHGSPENGTNRNRRFWTSKLYIIFRFHVEIQGHLCSLKLT